MKTLLPVLLLSLTLTSCASIVSGGPDPFAIDTLPPGATVFLDDQAVGVSPCQIMVPKIWGAGDLSIRWPTGETLSTTVPRTINPWVIGNIIFGGIIGVVVDCSVGSCRTVSGAGEVYTKPPG